MLLDHRDLCLSASALNRKPAEEKSRLVLEIGNRPRNPRASIVNGHYR